MSFNRIAVVRALQLGDMLCAVPALRALRMGLPSAEITLIGLRWAACLVDRYDTYLDDFLEFPGWPGLAEQACQLPDVPAFVEVAQSRHFDLAIQMHGSGGITNPLVALLGARHTAGFYSRGGFVPEPALFIEYPDCEPEICRLLRLVEHLGFPPHGTELEFPIRDSDREDLSSLALPRDPYVCIHPGGTRRAPPQAFAAVADALLDRGLQVLITGTQTEWDNAWSVQCAMRNRALNLAGRTSLGALAALLESARLLVCNDTGVSHLAAAVGTPSVVLFTNSDPRRWAPLDSSRHRPIIAAAASADLVRNVLTEVDDLLGRAR